MHIDLSSISSAPPSTDASCASSETRDAASAFAALLDDVAGMDRESGQPSPPANDKDADEEDMFDELAALAMTCLLSLNTPVETPVEAVNDASTGTGEITEAVAIDQVTLPDASSDLGALGEGSHVAAAIDNRGEGPAVPAWNANVRTAAADADADAGATGPERAAASDNDVVSKAANEVSPRVSDTLNSEQPQRDSAAPAPAPVETARAPQAMKGARGSRGSKPPRAGNTSPAEGTGNQAGAAVAQAVTAAAATATPVIAETRDTDRVNTADTQAPTSTAARLARALQRAAAVTTGGAAFSAQVADTESGSSQSSSSGGGESTDRGTQTFAAPRQTSGGVLFTVAAPTPIDIRSLARAVDAASHAVEGLPSTIPERDVVAQLVQSMRVQFRDGIGEAVVKLKPEHLGSVQVSLRIENGAVTATVQADVASVRQWIESQQETLRTSLAEQGLRLERFVVEPDGERQSARDDAQPREQRRRQQQRRVSAKDHPVFEITV
jgi:flagellar hook-length control protein FliK